MGKVLLVVAALTLGSASAEAATLEFLSQPPPVVYNNAPIGKSLQLALKNDQGEIETWSNNCVVSLSLITKHELGRINGTTVKMTVNGVVTYGDRDLRIETAGDGGSFRLLAEAAGIGCEKHGIAISDIVVVQRGR